jgi:hypothetical protein
MMLRWKPHIWQSYGRWIKADHDGSTLMAALSPIGPWEPLPWGAFGTVKVWIRGPWAPVAR